MHTGPRVKSGLRGPALASGIWPRPDAGFYSDVAFDPSLMKIVYGHNMCLIDMISLYQHLVGATNRCMMKRMSCNYEVIYTWYKSRIAEKSYNREPSNLTTSQISNFKLFHQSWMWKWKLIGFHDLSITYSSISLHIINLNSLLHFQTRLSNDSFFANHMHAVAKR